MPSMETSIFERFTVDEEMLGPVIHMCLGSKQTPYIGDKLIPPLVGILIIGL